MMLWQSFDHPTDTFLPSMNIWRSRRTQEGNRLVSWKGPEDPSAGTFSLSVETDPFIQGFIWNGSLPEWRSSVWMGFMVSSQYFQRNTSVGVYMTYVDTTDEVYMAFTVNDGAPPVRAVMSYSGRVETRIWDRVSSDWAMVAVSPNYHECSRYSYCGPSGYCDHTDATPTCKCLRGSSL
jgi:hypothetical protein